MQVHTHVHDIYNNSYDVRHQGLLSLIGINLFPNYPTSVSHKLYYTNDNTND